jgi:hypothetical protein
MEPHRSAPTPGETSPMVDEAQSAASWGAIFAGAVAALAISFVLMALAGGFGLKLLFPWPGGRTRATDFTPILGAWMIVVQVLSSALGGYLAGRLRTKWTHIHGHETYFRDTAHGLLTWAVAVLAGAVLVATVAGPMMAERATMEASAAAYADAPPPMVGAPVTATLDPATLRARAVREANLAAQSSFFTGVGLLLGAFTACVAAAVGGLRRDDMHTRYWTERSRVGT